MKPGVSYVPSPIKLRDYAARVMAAFSAAVEYLGGVLPAVSDHDPEPSAVRVPSHRDPPLRPSSRPTRP
jgi:hypothetical protein